MSLSEKYKEGKNSDEKKISQESSEKDEDLDNLEIRNQPLTEELIFDMNK